MADPETGLTRSASFVRPIALVGVIALAALGWFALRAGDHVSPVATLPPAPVAGLPAVPVISPAARSAVLAPPPSPPQLSVPGPAAVLPGVAATAPPGTVTSAGSEPLKPSFDIVRVSPTGAAILAGRAEPGAQVQVADNGRDIGSAKADGSGQWVITPSAPLAAGGRELTLKAVAPDGHVSAGDAPVMVLLPQPMTLSQAGTAAPEPKAASPATDSVAMAILLPSNAPARLLQAAPDAAPDAAPTGKTGPSLDVVDYDEHGAIRFAGTASPGSEIRFYIDDLPVGDAATDARGHWGLSPNAVVSYGDHRLRIDQLSAAGHAVARAEFPFQRAELSAKDVSGDHVVVQPRQNLWRLARRAYGRGVRYTIIYLANRDQIRDPNLIYPGQLFSIPATKP